MGNNHPERAMPNPAESLSVIIPFRNASAVIEPRVTLWAETLARLDLDHEVLLINDGSTDDSLAKAESLAAKFPALQVISLEKPTGYGACVKAALMPAKHPLVLLTALDYPYTPGDLPVFLERIRASDERIQQATSLIVGCRTGQPVPAFWQAVGVVYRGFLRIALGIHVEPIRGWLGLAEHLRAWRAWLVFGVPFQDPNCAFKLIRRSMLDRFPLQSDGDFVHAEIAAKCTFLTAILDEIPLTPKLDAIPATEWRESGMVFRKAKFHAPTPSPVVP
jgi:glycosyltransferase involved in cell wall biosynthesis